jgi:hypothetical protein
MMMRPTIAVTLAALFFAAPAGAHHSFAMYDLRRVETVEGVVREFRWVNPHSSMVVVAARPGAAPEVWAIEMTSPGNLTRLGWTRKSFRPGDRVRVEFSPLRNGKRGGGFRSATLLETGQVMTARMVDLEKRD